MRRLPAAVAALGLVSVALVGCSSVQTSTCDRQTVPGNLANLISVSGEGESVPDVSVPTPFTSDGLRYADFVTGEGTQVVDANQLVDIGITLVDGETGRTLVTQGYDGEAAVGTVALWDSSVPGLADALLCAGEGSRIVVSFSPEQLADAVPVAKAGGGSVVAVVDLQKVYLSAANGADQFNESHGLPSVVRDPAGRPGITIPDAAAPTEPVVQVLKKGEGPALAPGDVARLNFLSVDWVTERVSQTTWGDSPQPLPITEGEDVIVNALIGQPVGSQLMIIVPNGEGAEAGADVYVIDILGVDSPAG